MILRHNKRHLQPATIEEGRVHNPIMQALISDQGCNNLVNQLLSRVLPLSEVTDKAIKTWLNIVQQTVVKMIQTIIHGAISVAEFQAAFKAVKEHTTSSPSSLHYSIWKVVAQEDDIAKWMSITMSLPFMYGFVNYHWSTVIDVMLKKKIIPGKSINCKLLES